jgi:predicted DNA-binding ribbon-helix-helix protein
MSAFGVRADNDPKASERPSQLAATLFAPGAKHIRRARPECPLLETYWTSREVCSMRRGSRCWSMVQLDWSIATHLYCDLKSGTVNGKGSNELVMTGTPVVNSRSGGQGTDARAIKRSIVRDGHKSSVSLETPFWEALREIASDRKMTVSELVATIDHGRNRYNLSSAIRVFVLGHFRRNSEHNIAVGRSDTGTGTTAPS